MGFVIILVMGVYLALSVVLVGWAIGHAKQTGKNVKRWGWGIALAMFLIPFWDWLPTVAVHQYYCSTESGFWVYKTLDQWKQENPGVMLSLMARSSDMKLDTVGYAETHHLNQRLDWVINLHRVSGVLPVTKREETLVDVKNNEALVRFVDFSSGDQRSTGTTKFWLVSNDCNGGEVYRVRMGQFIDKVYAEAKGDKK